jgi:hypothetical protein
MAVQNKAAVDIDGGSIEGITDLAIADGGTGASTAAAARTNLDVYSKAEAAAEAANYAYSKAQVDSLNENPIINPCMEIWQRGTSFLGAASGIYTADRWAYSKSNTAVHDITTSTDVPSVAQAGVAFNFSVLIDCTTADAAVAAGDYVQFYQVIEGYHWRHFAQRDLTLSFWVKATKTGTYCLSLTNNGGDRSFVAEYTINAADTWEKKIINIAASPSAGTWNYTNGHGLIVRYCLASGTTYHGSTGWSAGNFLATSNQVNACDDVANNWRLTGVKLELGNTATPLRFRSFKEELALCQRYYESSGDSLYCSDVTSPGVYYHTITFHTYKRTNPTMAFTHVSASLFPATNPALLQATPHGFVCEKTANGTGTAGFYRYSWTANAEL